MNLKTQKRLASRILKVGKKRVQIDPDELETVNSAVTREDVRKLIYDGIIQVKQKDGVSRHRARARHIQRTKGRGSGQGKRRGKSGARFSRKDRWISTIRPIRKELKSLRDSGIIEEAVYRKVYRMAKGGLFRSKSHMKSYLKKYNMMRE